MQTNWRSRNFVKQLLGYTFKLDSQNMIQSLQYDLSKRDYFNSSIRIAIS